MAAAMGIVVAEASLMLRKYQRRRSLSLINRGKKRAPWFLVHQNKNKAKKIKKNTPGSFLRYYVGEDNSACVFSCLRSRRKPTFISTVKPTQRAFVRFAVKLEISAIIRRFRERNISFAFARGVEVPFTPSELSIILGLSTKGQPVDVNLKMKSRTMERLFSGKLQNLNRKNIVNKLDELANKDKMRKCVGAGGNRKKYLDGCTVGLMVTQKLIEFIRLYRWGECKLPNKVHNAEDRLKSITAEMVFEFNPTSQELCLLNPDSAVAAIVRAKDQEIKELKKIGDNDGEEKERKYEEEEDEEDEEMDEEKKDNEDEKEKAEQDEQKEEKIKEGQDDKKGKKEDGEDEEGKEKKGEKEEERKDENQTKHRACQVSCHHEVEMNKKLEVIYRKLDFGEWDYEAVRTLSSIVDDLNSPLSTTLAKRAKQRNEESDHDEEKKTIPE
ncbi:hypothetical protein CDL12_22263 [Handroanthus impetiginosus]|uniref:Uncharacterized protein n=1 Tax=Handroanthus impetiginosus TaxID=429701 RepID=A0A2G9GIS8_9LAMI|nr:hypothetical protein CDL12_22263 [Handroanthus impetiginosus]